MRPVGLFVDVPSLYFSVKRKFGEDKKVDYSKLLTTVINEERTVFAQRAYVLTHKDAHPEKFIAALKHAGYNVISKTPRFIDKGKHMVVKNDNFDCQITLDVMQYLPQLTEVVLCVHSENMLPLITRIKDSGRRVIIYSCGVPNSIKNIADETIELTEEVLL
jgi:uncharacterized LabA/DUF88 family protein